MTTWWRFHISAVHNRKILRLSDAMFRAWTTLLCFAADNDGVLPSAADIATELREKPQKVAEWITVLCAAGLIDKTERGFVPHDWNERQYKSDATDPTGASRSKRYRDAKKNVTRGDRDASRDATVLDKRPETETEAETETDKKKTRASALASPWDESDRERFWSTFPNKVGKPDAMRAFDKATRKTTPEILFAGLQRYVGKTDDRPWCNPATWLNQERWNDEPAKPPNPLLRQAHRQVAQGFESLLQRSGPRNEQPSDHGFDLDLTATRTDRAASG